MGKPPRLFPSNATCCNADLTAETAMVSIPRGRRRKMRRAKQIHHVRGEQRFWHWSDIYPVEPPSFKEDATT